jgi:hypothetical protein
MSKADKLLKRIEFYEKMASSQKPENEDLLKKASLYERLALYSDRKSFLSALAGGATSNWAPKMHSDAEVKGALQRVADGINQWREQYGDRMVDASGAPRTFPRVIAQDQHNIAQLVTVPKLDLDNLQLAYTSLSNLAQLNNKGFERDALVAYQQQVGQAAGSAQQLVGEQISALQEWKANIPPETSGEVSLDTGAPAPGQQAPAKPRLPSINPKDQESVFQFAIEQGELVPNPDRQQPDGQLGSETRKALEGVKNYFAKKNRNNPRMTDQEAIQAAKFKGR